MKARIADKREVAEETLSVTYDLLGKDVSFKPGQHFFIHLINPLYRD